MRGDGVLRGDTSWGVSLFCLVLELVAKGWAKSPSPQLQRVGIAVPDSSLLGCLLLFVSPTLPRFSSLLFPALTVPSPFHSPSSPSLSPAVMNKPSCADLTPQIWLFSPQHFLSSSHLCTPAVGLGKLPIPCQSPQSMALPSHPPHLLPPSSSWSCLGQQERRNDLSHPIHADNCLLDPEANECWKEPPAYTFRDYR